MPVSQEVPVASEGDTSTLVQLQASPRRSWQAVQRHSVKSLSLAFHASAEPPQSAAFVDVAAAQQMAGELALENEELRQELGKWQQVGANMAARGSRALELLDVGGPQHDTLPAAQASSTTLPPEQRRRQQGGESSGVRRRRRTNSLQDQDDATALLELAGLHDQKEEAGLMDKGARHLRLPHPRQATLLALVFLPLALGAVILAIILYRSVAASAIAWWFCVAHTWKTCRGGQPTVATVEIAELRLEQLNGSSMRGTEPLRVVVQAGSSNRVMRTRAGIASEDHGDTQAFTDVMTLSVRQDDPPYVFSVLRAGNGTNDKVAAVTTSAAELLNLALHEQQHVRFHLSLQNTRASSPAQEEFSLPSPVLGMRLRALDSSRRRSKA